MENLEGNEIDKAKPQGKWEVKDYIGADQLKIILREWLNALDNNRDLEVFIKGENCRVPKDAFLYGKTKAEFEFKKGEYEFEIELKWKDSDLNTKQ